MDGIANHFDLDSDNDGCYDSFEAGVTGSSISESIIAGPYGANGLADALETSIDSDTINYDLQCDDILNANLNKCGPEICGDGFDNDRDGYTDNYDTDCNPVVVPSCVGIATPADFTIQNQSCTTTGGYTAYQTPMVADIDRDGIPDIIAGSNIGSDSIVILNSTTLERKDAFAVEGGAIRAKWNAVAVAQIDGSGYLEIAYMTDEDRIMLKRHNGTSWEHFESNVIPTSIMNTSSDGQTNGAIGFADFDQDGTAEIHIGNQIYSVDFNLSLIHI